MKLLCSQYIKNNLPPKESIIQSLKLTSLFTAILLFIMALCFQDSLVHIGHMTVLRLIRSFVFTWAVFTILPSVFDKIALKSSLQKSKLISCACCTILWIAIYTAVFSRIPDALQKDIGNYYIFPCLFFALQLLCIVGISHLHQYWRILCSFLYATGIFLLFICAIFYASYALIYGQPFDEYALLSVIATNPDEIINYLTATFSTVKLLFIVVLIIALFTVILQTTLHITIRPYTGHIHKKRITIFSLIIVYFFINYLMTIFPADQILHLRGCVKSFV